MTQLKTTDLAFIGLCAAILCILAPISIPIPFSPVPVTLAFFAVILTGAVLGKWKGTICVLVYIMIGLVGFPVFSSYGSGIQKVIGPTGGYLIGYIFLAWFVGFFAERYPGKRYCYFIGALIGTVICYAFGTIWLAIQLKMTVMQALAAGVIPFIPLDLVKIAAAVLVAFPIRNRLALQNII